MRYSHFIRGCKIFPKYNRVFVYYPRGKRSGGPEALHQLVDSLRRQGVDAALVPYPSSRHLPRVADYDIYDAPEAEAVDDARNNAVVAGESQYPLLARVKYARPICWWLSIDYSYLYNSSRRSFHAEHERKTLASSLRTPAARLRGAFRRYASEDSHFLHLTQSQYAWSYLVDRKQAMPSMLSDYTPRLHLMRDAPSNVRAGISYNATKAEYVTSRLARHMPHVKFIPIIGMSQDEVYRALKRTQIYLDMGSHPGKDRIPREAAIAGNVVVVGLRGAAAYSADVPIPFSHKLLMEGDYEIQAAQRLNELLAAVSEAYALQAHFRETISHEMTIFDLEVKAFFIDGLQGFDAGHRADFNAPIRTEQPTEK